mmetsp:Transcript_5492/g.9933  ORF Transcript_5492/g.9933 Transcript_5492/m.9933 type:complete len:483 (+) Transcript_5492:1383-2831(+)
MNPSSTTNYPPSLISLLSLYSSRQLKGTEVGVVVGSIGVLLEVILEHAAELLGSGVVGVLVGPGVPGVEHVSLDSGEALGHGEAEDLVGLELGVVDASVEDGVDAGAGVLDAHAFSDAVASSGPPGVDEVGLCSVGLELLLQELGVAGGVDGEEGRPEAGREVGGRLGDAALGSGDLTGVAGDELVKGLAGGQLGNGGEDSVGVAGEENAVLGVGGLLFLEVPGDVKDGVRDAAVLRLACVEVVGNAVVLDGDVLEHRVGGDGAVDLGLSLLREVDGLGVAASLEVEDAVLVPAVLVVADEGAVRVGGEGGLSGSGEAEEEGGVTVLTDIGRAVHREVVDHGEPVVHEGEDSLLVLSSVPGAEDDGGLGLDVKGDGNLGVEAVLLPFLVGGGAGVDDGEVDVTVALLLRADEHVGDKVLLPRKLVDEPDLPLGGLGGSAVDVGDVELLLAVHVVDGSLVQILVDLGSDGLVDIAPPQVLVRV